MTATEPPSFYVLDEGVRSFDVGPDQRIKVRSLLQYLQEAAAGHARRAGDTFDKQVQQGAVWVLTRLHVRMDRWPCWEEPLRIETWSVGIESFSAIRDFRMEDGQGACGTATTQWVLMGLEKRRPLRIPAGLEMGYGRRPERALDDPFKPLPVFEKPQYTETFIVRRSDLDSLDHVNNAVAVEWCLESLPAERVEGLRLVSVEVAFKKEMLGGDVFAAESLETAPQEDLPTFLHRLVRSGDGAVAAQARSRWTQASET